MKHVKFMQKDHKEIQQGFLTYWEQKPQTAAEMFEYGMLNFRVTDYGEAVKWYEKAAKAKYLSAIYEYGYCLKYGLGIEQNETLAEKLFAEYLSRFLAENEKTPQNLFRQGMCYAYGLGCERKNEAAVIFQQLSDELPEAVYQLAVAWRDGTLGLLQNKQKAEELFMESYWAGFGDGIFAAYELFDGAYQEYPYQKELTEATSYRLGKYMRTVHVNPSAQAYQFLADLYLQGFPGDQGEDDVRFKRKAQLYLKKIENLKQEGVGGKDERI